ncbi:uncharacterized protein LOC144546042 isoform X1 [Carex rostrata]
MRHLLSGVVLRRREESGFGGKNGLNSVESADSTNSRRDGLVRHRGESGEIKSRRFFLLAGRKRERGKAEWAPCSVAEKERERERSLLREREKEKGKGRKGVCGARRQRKGSWTRNFNSMELIPHFQFHSKINGNLSLNARR